MSVVHLANIGISSNNILAAYLHPGQIFRYPTMSTMVVNAKFEMVYYKQKNQMYLWILFDKID